MSLFNKLQFRHEILTAECLASCHRTVLQCSAWPSCCSTITQCTCVCCCVKWSHNLQGCRVSITSTCRGAHGRLVDEETVDMVLEFIFLGGVTGAVLGSLLTAGRAVPVFRELVPKLSSPYTSTYHLHLSPPPLHISYAHLFIYTVLCYL